MAVGPSIGIIIRADSSSNASVAPVVAVPPAFELIRLDRGCANDEMALVLLNLLWVRRLVEVEAAAAAAIIIRAL